VEGKVLKMFCGFYGELYFNKQKHQMVLVIKGTDKMSVGNIKTDLIDVLLKSSGAEINSAFTFGEKIRKLIGRFKSKIQLFITGHSLGGYLAQMVTFTIKHVCIKNGAAHKNDNQNEIHPHTVVFDSPPCFDRIKQIAQENPVSIKSLWLDVTNYVIDRNAINAFSKLGPHIGTVITLRDVNELKSPTLWSMLKNVGLHGINNFNEISQNELSKFVDISRADAVPFDPKIIPWFAFSEWEIESLKAVPYLALTDKKVFDELSNFQFIGNSIKQTGSVRKGEFIPQARYFLTKHREKFKGASKEVQKHFDSMMKEAWKLLYDSPNEISYSLRDDLTESIKSYPDGAVISGLQNDAEKLLLAKLMYNSIPNLYFIHQPAFLKIEAHQRENWLRTFSGTLVLILNENEKFSPFETHKTKVLILGNDVKDNFEKTINFVPLNLAVLSDLSRDIFVERKLHFFGNNIPAFDVFQNIIGDVTLTDILSFNCSIQESKSMWDTGFYIEQDISNEVDIFSSVESFAVSILDSNKNAFLISSNAGMGKSTYLRMLRIALQNKLPDHWIVKLDLNICHNEFYEIKNEKNTFETTQDALNLIAKKMEPFNLVRRRVLEIKLASKRAMFLFDAFDEVCPYYRKVAKKFIKLIHGAGMSMVLTTRPQEEQEILQTLEPKDWNVFKLKLLDMHQQINYLAQYWKFKYLQDEKEISAAQNFADDLEERSHLINEIFKLRETEGSLTFLRRDAENILLELTRKFSGRSKSEELWGIPLQLRMVAEAFPTGKLTDDFLEHSDLFKIFIEQRITGALKEKFNYDLTQAKQREDLDKKELEIRVLLYKLAAASLFEEGRCKWVKDAEISLSNTLGLAIVTDSISGHEVIFLHKTFAEYLYAESLVAKIYNVSEAKMVTLPAEKFGDILLQLEYNLVRRFINTIIAHSRHTKSRKARRLYSASRIRSSSSEVILVLIMEDLVNIYKMLTSLKVKFDLNKGDFDKNIFANVYEYFASSDKDKDYVEYPLYLAIKHCCKDFIVELVKNGADIKKVDCSTRGKWVLHLAVEKGLNQLIMENFEHMGFMINTPDYNKMLPIHYATSAGNLELVKFLVEKGSDCNFGDFNRLTPMHLAIENDNLEAVKLIREAKNFKIHQVGWRGWTPLHAAVHWRRKEIISHLISRHGLDLEFKCREGTALHLAVEIGADEIVRLLLDKGADLAAVTHDEQTCLHIAAQHFRGLEFPWSLFVDKIPINSRDVNNQTPLYVAAGAGQVDAVKSLLEKGADPNLQAVDLMTPLHVAVSSYKFNVVQCLLDHEGCEIDLKDDEGSTPLHLACMEGFADIMGLLISKGANPNVKDCRENTPLQLAVTFGHQDAIRFLQGLRNIGSKISMAIM